MLGSQVDRYRSAVGRPNIASRVGQDQMPTVQSMNSRADSIARQSAGGVSGAKARTSRVRDSGLSAARSMTAPRQTRSNGSMAGYIGGRSSWIQPNGSGYNGSSRKFSTPQQINSVSTRSFSGSSVKNMRSHGLQGRYARNSKAIIGEMSALNNMV